MNEGKKYRQAAVAYFVYGLIYLLGAYYLARSGAGPAAMGGSAAVWFGLGALMVVVLPVLIWKEYKWVARILALLVLVRIVGLVRLITRRGDEVVAVPWGEASLLYGAIFFLLVAVATAVMLARAGWPNLFRIRAGNA